MRGRSVKKLNYMEGVRKPALNFGIPCVISFLIVYGVVTVAKTFADSPPALFIFKYNTQLSGVYNNVLINMLC